MVHLTQQQKKTVDAMVEKIRKRLEEIEGESDRFLVVQEFVTIGSLCKGVQFEFKEE